MTIEKISISLFFMLVLSMNLPAQQPLNLGFEIKSVEGANRPWGWDLKSWGPVSFKMDSGDVKNGKFSLNSVCTNAQDQNAGQSFRFIIEAFELKNKKITLSGSIKTAGLKGAASLSIGYSYYDKKAEQFVEVDTASLKASGSSGWKTYSVNLLIPAKAQSVYVLANHSGNGKAWFDDLKLSVAGKPVNTVMVAKPLLKENINWLNNNSSPVYSVIPTGNNKNEDLASFKRATANSNLVALGESTHGTGEFFSLKNRLFQYAVTELGFRVFAIEDNQLAVEQVNKYVHGGKGTAMESMSGMFAVWYTEEVHALIEWVRSYNDAHPENKLSFVGFDMQEIGRPVDSLADFLKNRDEEFYIRTAGLLKDLKDNGPKSYAINDSIKLNWYNAAKAMLDELKQKSVQWLSVIKNEREIQNIMLGIQYANLVRQFAENAHKGYWALYRDEAMAENVSWLLEQRFPQSRILIWAHDVHVSRCDHPDEQLNLNHNISMGSFLSKKYGSGYRSFSLATYQGEYLALKSYTDFTRVNAPLFKGPAGSLDEALHQVILRKKSPAVFLPLPRTETWLSAPLPKRFANHVNIDYGYWERISIPYQFDGVFFIDKTTPSKYLEKKK